MRTIYTMRYRPISTWTLPSGLKWQYAGAPHNLFTRPDLPRSNFQFGTFTSDRQLTGQEMADFEIMQVSIP